MESLQLVINNKHVGKKTIRCSSVVNPLLSAVKSPLRTYVSPSLDLFASVGKPVVDFEGGDSLQV